MDKGSWKVNEISRLVVIDGTERYGIAEYQLYSEDSRHDVIMDINGDFESLAQAKAYVEWLCETLNRSASSAEQEKGNAT